MHNAVMFVGCMLVLVLGLAMASIMAESTYRAAQWSTHD